MKTTPLPLPNNRLQCCPLCFVIYHISLLHTLFIIKTIVSFNGFELNGLGLTIRYFRLAPAAAAASNPYLQQMYAAAAAASNPYAGLQGTGLISLAQTPMAGQAAAATAAGATTGNPLLDAYGQYAALAAATGVYTTSASATGASFTSPLDTAQAASK